MVVTVDKGIVDSIRKDGCIAKKCNNHQFLSKLGRISCRDPLEI